MFGQRSKGFKAIGRDSTTEAAEVQRSDWTGRWQVSDRTLVSQRPIRNREVPEATFVDRTRLVGTDQTQVMVRSR